VQPALRSDVTQFLAAENVQSYHHDEGMAALKPALAILESAGLGATAHVHVGTPAEVIAHVVDDLGADVVLMGTHGRGALVELLLGSVATGVVQAVRVPVMLVR
jgi:nucleotide-binding universal stress UspA family protein